MDEVDVVDEVDESRWIGLDRSHVWHPFTQMKGWMERNPIVLVEGEGVYLTDSRGRRYIDGISSMWCNIHGHRRAELDAAINAQLGRVCHTTLLGFTNPPAAERAGRLVKFLPKGLSRIFYSDNGSTAVEVSLKMAYQYWQHAGEKNRRRFLSLNMAYHGDTLGAVSVGGIDIFHSAFAPMLMEGMLKAPAPYCYRCEMGLTVSDCHLACAGRLEEELEKNPGEVAAVIMEPGMLGAGGMIAAPKGYLRRVADACRRHDVLLILDEVATGFGRTGKMFACEHEDVSPDLICLSKGLTGGYLPLAVTAAGEKIFDAFLGEFSELKTFFHGHTYTGNPLACAVALASLDLFDSDRVLEAMGEKIEMFRAGLERIGDHPNVGDVRNLGLMAGIELVRDRATGESFGWQERAGWRVCEEAQEMGLILRPLGNVVVLMPPLSISMDELGTMMEIVEEAIRRSSRPEPIGPSPAGS